MQVGTGSSECFAKVWNRGWETIPGAAGITAGNVCQEMNQKVVGSVSALASPGGLGGFWSQSSGEGSGAGIVRPYLSQALSADELTESSQH